MQEALPSKCVGIWVVFLQNIFKYQSNLETFELGRNVMFCPLHSIMLLSSFVLVFWFFFFTPTYLFSPLGQVIQLFPCYSCSSESLNFASGSSFSCPVRNPCSKRRWFLHSLVLLLFPFFHSHCFFPLVCSPAICVIASCLHHKL